MTNTRFLWAGGVAPARRSNGKWHPPFELMRVRGKRRPTMGHCSITGVQPGNSGAGRAASAPERRGPMAVLVVDMADRVRGPRRVLQTAPRRPAAKLTINESTTTKPAPIPPNASAVLESGSALALTVGTCYGGRDDRIGSCVPGCPQ